MGKRGGLAGIASAIGSPSLTGSSRDLQPMGNVTLSPAVLAAWSPDLLFGMAGSYLLLRTPT